MGQRLEFPRVSSAGLAVAGENSIGPGKNYLSNSPITQTDLDMVSTEFGSPSLVGLGFSSGAPIGLVPQSGGMRAIPDPLNFRRHEK